jgi:hypothetical protein
VKAARSRQHDENSTTDSFQVNESSTTSMTKAKHDENDKSKTTKAARRKQPIESSNYESSMMNATENITTNARAKHVGGAMLRRRGKAILAQCIMSQ